MRACASLIMPVVLACSLVQASQLSLTLENDCFLPDKSLGRGDHDYTHGTGIEFIDNDFNHFKLGQDMYAPSDLRRSDHIKGDRPYAGMIYGGAGRELFRDSSSPWTHYAEIDIGMIGPAAFCGHTQRFIHKVLGCRDPKGWHHQLHNEVVVNGQWWTKYNYYICDYVALVPRVGALAGTIQDAAEAGCDLKVGWNLKNDVGNNLMFSSSKHSSKSLLDKLIAYMYIGADERFYLYNHLLEGSFIRNRDKDLAVDIERFVGEIQCGLCVKYDRASLKYYMAFRQDEFEHQKHSPNYAGLSFSWTF